MSMHNANAFYELAIRHMVGPPTIHMILRDWKIPFDVAPYRAITFSRIDYADFEAAKEALKSTVEEVIKPDFVVENPITHARGVAKIKEHASDELRVILDEMQSLRERVYHTELMALVASQNAKAALNIPADNLALARLLRGPDLNALAAFNPAAIPLMMTPPPPSSPPETAKMDGIFGLSPSNSNQTLDGVIVDGLREMEETKEK